MALSKTFAFLSDAENFAYSGTGTGSWNGSDGQPAGCIQVAITGRNATGSGYFTWEGTWEQLGIPANSSVYGITGTTWSHKGTSTGTPDILLVGPVDLANTSGVSQGNMFTQQGSVHAWTSTGGSLVTVPVAMRPSSTTVRIRVYFSLDNPNSRIDTVGLADQLVFSIDYNPPAKGNKAAYLKGGGSLKENRTAYLQGSLLSGKSNKYAYTHGLDTFKGSHPAYLEGTTAAASVKAHTTAFVKGGLTTAPHLLDDFNRPNGSLGANWYEFLSGNLVVESNECHATSMGSDKYAIWQTESFGATQKAFLRVVNITNVDGEYDLILKKQGATASPSSACIEICYNYGPQRLGIWYWTDNWYLAGSNLEGFSLAVGDIFSAIAHESGLVQVFKNGSLVLEAVVPTLATSGGYVGVWIIGATSVAALDDFGGGTIECKPAYLEGSPGLVRSGQSAYLHGQEIGTSSRNAYLRSARFVRGTTYTEDFEGALGALPAPWTKSDTYDGGIQRDGNGHGQGTASTGDNCSYYKDATFKNQVAQFQVVELGLELTAVLRWSPETFYAVSYGTEAPAHFYINIATQKTWNSLYAFAPSTLNVGDIVRVELHDYTFSIFVNGIFFDSWTDLNTLLPSGYVGLDIYKETGKVDLWEGGSLDGQPAYLEGVSEVLVSDHISCFMNCWGQIQLPDTDGITNLWVNETGGEVLYPSLADESNNTYATLDNAGVGAFFDVALEDFNVLEDGTTYYEWSAWRISGEEVLTMECQLWCGEDLIAIDSRVLSDTPQTFRRILTIAEKQSIASTIDLRLRYIVTGVS